MRDGLTYTPAMSETVRPRGRAVQERSIDTQARILESAVTALVDHGYSGASTLRIQQIAGVSRGRLLHHFPSRDDLLVAAVAHLTEARIASLADDLVWPDGAGERIDLVVGRMWESFREPYFWASTELWIAARANPRLREALQPHERRLGASITGHLATLFGPALASNSHYVMARDLLITSMRGVALTYAFRPRDELRDPHLAQWRAIARDLLLDRVQD